jgi:predicted amidophosphoribosyltransferase
MPLGWICQTKNPPSDTLGRSPDTVRSIANAILAATVASPCATCGRVLDAPLDGAVCDECWRSIVTHNGTFSLGAVSYGRSIGAYEGALREILHAFKYDGRRSLGVRLARMMAECGADILEGADLTVPVPLHRRRKRERGFNQAEDLAKHLGLPTLQLLRRVRHTRSQIDLPSDARRQNVSGAFSVAALYTGERIAWARTVLSADRWPSALIRQPLRDRVIVLVDDITTTGATLDACASVLRRAGAREVRALTAARVVTGRR